MAPIGKASAAALAIVFALAADARADTTLEARAALMAGATDNVLLDPVAQRSALVTSANAGLWVDRLGEASRQSFNYGVRALGYTDPNAVNTVFHSLAGNSSWDVGRAGSFTLGLSGSAGRMNALDPVLSAQLARAAGGPLGGTGSTMGTATGMGPAPMVSPTGGAAPMQTLLGGRPTGQVLFLSGELREGYNQAIGQFWHLRQLGSAAAYVPLEDAAFVRNAYFLQHVLGGERELPRGSAGLSLRLGQTMTEALSSPQVMLPSQQVSFGELWAIWRHELTATVESMVSAGSYAIWSFADDRYLAGPVWRGSLTWQPRVDAHLSVQAARSIQPSLMLGYTLRADSIGVEAGRALDPGERWTLLLGGNWMRGRQIQAGGDLGGLINVRVARASLRYDPEGPLRYGVDVSHIDQDGQASQTLFVPRTEQTMFLFLIEAVYPARDRAGQKLMAQN
jgi:hypothetical protein